MSNLINTKRNSLETFIREQMIGPNGCNGKFTLSAEDFTDSEEVVNTTPGSIYSTAILFPKKAVTNWNSILEDDVDVLQENVETTREELDETRTDINEQDGGMGDVDDEDIYSLSRRFPNTIGLSCCLSSDVNLNEDVKITISGRYYTKITGIDKQKIQVLITDNVLEFEKFWEENQQLHPYFTYSKGRLSINNISKLSGEVKHLIKENNQNVAIKLAKENGILDEVKENDRFLLSYREYLFNKKLTKLLSNGSYLDDREKETCLSLLSQFEQYETFISYFEDLLELYDAGSFGFWRSHTFIRDVSIKDILFDSNKIKQVYSPDNFPSLKDIIKVPLKKRRDESQEKEKYLSLSLWLQVTRNSKDSSDKNIYLKTLLENTSTPFTESPKNYFSIVNEKVNELSFFGVKIEVESDKIQPYHEQGKYKDSTKEEDRLNFLYRNLSDYAVGHLCSARWFIDENNNVTKVATEFMPSYETPDIEPVPRDKYGDFVEENGHLVPSPFLTDDSCLQFKWLSTFSNVNDETILTSLKSFVKTYENWILKMREKVSEDEKIFANANLDSCMKDCQRMIANIDGILSNPKNMETFRMMNSAMFIQLWHKEKQYKTDKPISDLSPEFYKNASDFIFSKDKHAAWRPFQLAFILLNMDGIIQHPLDSDWKFRNEIVDLVWFPTGGGKTEAYLGLIALCILNRRRKFGKKGAGVTTIMRYTLRLLTTQQFQRALLLILALEQMRIWGLDKVKYSLGDEPVSIGLFVGSNSLPNTFKKTLSDNGLDEEANKWLLGQNSRIPLEQKHCPWCGEELGYDDGEFYCTNEDCTFYCDKNALPVRLCDEHIYKVPPTLLFGTVDKFAALAHKVSTNRSEINKDSRRIFGQGIECLPPDLIIQDELHLLMGPLGSAVSLFECAIDQLCTRKDCSIRPKIISSTATTRNTDLQIRALYDREVNIFPKNGITHDDSFFAFYKRELKDGVVSYVSKRKYLGIMPTGRTQMTTQMRLAAILFVHRALFEKKFSEENDYDKVANNYFTIISYFNSLKEVGKTDALFYTEYSKYTKRLFKRVMRFGDLLECFYANGDLHLAELSGRLNGSEINEKFAEVGQKWSIIDRLPHKLIDEGEEKWVKGITPPDYILATNMISVGLDIGRFNTIIMNSMPRNIAEYIQASSRVARNTLGLVLTLHNPFRSRDVSHFEKFKEFHEKLYYYVEPISITPFSQKSVEKYLPLYMATVIRHSFSELADRSNASSINNDDLIQKVKEKIIDYFKIRYERTQKLHNELQRGLLTEELQQYISDFVNIAIQQWSDLALKDKIVYNKGKQKKREVVLFTTPSDYDETKNLSYWTVPMSLRIVEPEGVLKIRIQ